VSVYHPDVEVTFSTEVAYTPVWVAQPAVEILATSEAAYDPPPSSGGQPSVVITTFTAVLYDAPHIYTDAEGSTEVVFTTRGAAEVELVPLPIPEHIEFEPIRRVSVTMPRPESFDRFGRPQ
jgi:hypothetical protein